MSEPNEVEKILNATKAIVQGNMKLLQLLQEVIVKAARLRKK
jgi:hypothetical protein